MRDDLWIDAIFYMCCGLSASDAKAITGSKQSSEFFFAACFPGKDHATLRKKFREYLEKKGNV
jgi:hypothetical protein